MMAYDMQNFIEISFRLSNEEISQIFDYIYRLLIDLVSLKLKKQIQLVSLTISFKHQVRM
jgi:hypothetical protein